MKCELTKEQFLRDIKRHEMTIKQDDGVFRHIKFSIPNNSNMHFYLTTWPNHLCISGDMGTMVFSRINDMFEFFGGGELEVNPSYWAQKSMSESQFGCGIEEWDSDAFEEAVMDEYNNYLEENDLNEDDEQAVELLEQMTDEILDYSESDHEAYVAINNFYYDSNYNFFEDFRYNCTKYTYHYMWLIHAIKWGVIKYKGVDVTI